MLPAADGFLGLEAAAVIPPEAARAIVVPFGYEGTVTYGGGTARGPAGIIAASHEVELYDLRAGCEAVHRYGVGTLRVDPPGAGVVDALAQLEEIVRTVLARGRFPLVLGGEHSITAGAIRPFVERYPDLAILHFDAHADLRDGYDGERYSHASALRRCLDHPIDTLVSVGVRNISLSEVEWLPSQAGRVHVHWAHDKRRYEPEAIVAPLAGRPVYLTFDVDGLDASLMPATGTPEPGGLFWDDVLPIIHAAARRSTIVGADVVELAPIEGMHGPDFVAARLCYSILNAALVPDPPRGPAR